MGGQLSIPWEPQTIFDVPNKALQLTTYVAGAPPAATELGRWVTVVLVLVHRVGSQQKWLNRLRYSPARPAKINGCSALASSMSAWRISAKSGFAVASGSGPFDSNWKAGHVR